MAKRSAPMSMPKSEKAMMDKYRAEDDLRTLQRAKEIEADAKRRSAAQKVAKEQVKQLTSIAGKSKK